MDCRNCNQIIPSGQRICPSCYQTVDGRKPDIDVKKKNVLLYLSEGNETFQAQVQEHLQPDNVEWCFFADSDEAFQEIVSQSARWYLLIVDAVRFESSKKIIESFRSANPECTVAVLTDSHDKIEPIANAIVLNCPSDLDRWLAMMHQLLRL